MHLTYTLEKHLWCFQGIHLISTCVPWDQTHANYAAITQFSANQAAQIPHFNADKRAQCETKYYSVGRSANLINTLIGCISAK